MKRTVLPFFIFALLFSVLLVVSINSAYGQIGAKSGSGSVLFMKSNSIAHLYMKISTSSNNQMVGVSQINVYDANLTNPNALDISDLTLIPNRTSVTLDDNGSVVDYTITAKNNLKGIYAIQLGFCGLSPIVVGLNETDIDPSILLKFFTAVYHCPAMTSNTPNYEIIGYTGIISKTLTVSENRTVHTERVNPSINSSQT